MSLSYLKPSKIIHSIIKTALSEDIGDGDYSTIATIPEKATGKAKLLVKEKGILSGIELVKMLYENYDPNLDLTIHKHDGNEIKADDIAFVVSGKIASILTTERLVLNFMQRMSGIATYVNKLNRMIAHTKAKLLDTRKTTPCFRLCEKWAVYTGGGRNHRYGLFDMIMLKDNHIEAVGGIKKAITKALEFLTNHNKKLKIVIEVRNLQEVQEVLKVGGIDRILLDNMSCNKIIKAIKLIDNRFETEASGNITEKNIVEIAECGVDFISMGALTHSVKSLDMSLKIY